MVAAPGGAAFTVLRRYTVAASADLGPPGGPARGRAGQGRRDSLAFWRWHDLEQGARHELDLFVLGAVLSWGLYGPALHRGQVALGNPLRALLCVGVAYFLIGVLVPVGALWALRASSRASRAPGVAAATWAGRWARSAPCASSGPSARAAPRST